MVNTKNTIKESFEDFLIRTRKGKKRTVKTKSIERGKYLERGLSYREISDW